MTKKKKKAADIGTILHKIVDQSALRPWADYMAGVDPWKRLEITADMLVMGWAATDAVRYFFSAADPRSAKVHDFEHEHGLIVFNLEGGRAVVEKFLKGPMPSGYGDGGYVSAIATKVRHKGTGKYLLSAAERVISEKFARIYLFVSESNHAAQRFYKSAGYEEIARAHDCLKAGNTELLLTKALSG
ncbi:MAG: GNAT family N-acetyltransferase [Deltaproteobacteria bacterium]|nr:GNAT family N-acetyltransferase [Deltaproteobacteria bacterium]